MEFLSHPASAGLGVSNVAGPCGHIALWTACWRLGEAPRYTSSSFWVSNQLWSASRSHIRLTLHFRHIAGKLAGGPAPSLPRCAAEGLLGLPSLEEDGEVGLAFASTLAVQEEERGQQASKA